MSQPYSKRLGAAEAIVAGAVTVGTVPASKRWIIRDVRWTQTGSGTARGQLKIPAVPGSVDYTPVMAQNDVRQLVQQHIVMNAGESVTMTPRSTTGTFSIEVQLHGYELDAT